MKYGRKFFLGCTVILFTFILALTQRLTPEAATIFTLVYGTFAGANAFITGKVSGGVSQ